MDFFSVEFFTALAIIIFIDLILAGDNAIVIGMAARNLPKENQRKVILWGTAGAILIRVIATLLIVQLLNLPWLQLAGGLLLVWIAIKLLTDQKDHEISAKSSIIAAIRTIIIADAAMGIDNVIAVAGAAKGSILLVILGLIISIPIMVWGSTLLIRWMDRFPAIIYLGSGVLAWTAAKMITGERMFEVFFKEHSILKWLLISLIIVSVIVIGKWINHNKQTKRDPHTSLDLPA